MSSTKQNTPSLPTVIWNPNFSIPLQSIFALVWVTVIAALRSRVHEVGSDLWLAEVSEQGEPSTGVVAFLSLD
ncbi:hypothetical protein Scep_019954 [Stephania cephalantha]|uniref:Uncharacterized protein n=1 Tax=Stephania cephalantha TaxID=152367 RepID=A0AAP0NNT1_9MAGN